MQYLFVQFWPWLLVALVLGLVFSFLPREATKERAPLPLIAFGAVIVAALLGFALARALGGRLGLSIEAALLMIASYLAGSVIGALVGGAAPVRMRAGWFGVPLLLLLWISGNFLKNAAIEGDVRARVAATVQKAGGDPLGLDVMGRDVLLPMDAATAAQRAQLSTVIRDVAGVRLVAEVPKLTGAAAEAFARAQAAREAAAKAAAEKAAAEKAAAEKAAAERAAAERAAAEKAAAERAAAEKAAAERAAAERAAAERAAAEKAAAERAAAEKAAADRAAAEKEAAEKAAVDKAAADKAAAERAAAERAAAEKAAAERAAAEKAAAERAAAERTAAERSAAERVAAERAAAEKAAAERAAAERAAAERAAAERAAAERLAAEKAAADKAAVEKAAADKANAEAAARAAAQRAAAAPVAPNVQRDVQGDVQRCKANLAALIPPDKILFRLGSINLSPEATDVLKKAVTLLAQCPALSVRVAGHADRSGSRTANKWLSRRRARAVYYYLRNAGVKEDQLTLTGYGSSKPIASDTAHSDRNRRVELVVR